MSRGIRLRRYEQEGPSSSHHLTDTKQWLAEGRAAARLPGLKELAGGMASTSRPADGKPGWAGGAAFLIDCLTGR